MTTKAEIAKLEKAFASWVKKYEVYSTLSTEEYIQIRDMDENYVWSEYQSDSEIYLTTGMQDPEEELQIPLVGYWLSKKPWTGEPLKWIDVFSSVQLQCKKCFGAGEDDEGDACQKCYGDGGEWISFDIDKYLN